MLGLTHSDKRTGRVSEAEREWAGSNGGRQTATMIIHRCLRKKKTRF